MHLYRCALTLLETTFFSSREISNTYYTEPYFGNIALAYALQLCQAPYFNDGSIYYKRDLTALNKAGIYVTPATIDRPQFTLSQFNAQPDAYWYAMANNTIVTRPDGSWTEKRGTPWYIIPPEGGKGKKVGPENRPQHGRIRALTVGNRATFFVISQQPLPLPRYIRLGKFMSKARLEITSLQPQVVAQKRVQTALALNPADLPAEIGLEMFDVIMMPPTPLIRNAHLQGDFYQVDKETFLPVGMAFGVADLPDN